MFSIRRRRGYALPERAATPERQVLSRRRLLGGMAGASAAALAGAAATPARARPEDEDPSRDLYPAPTHPDHGDAGRPLSDKSDVTTHVNFFEFSEPRFLDPLQWWTEIRPWTIRVEGLVAEPFTIDIDDLLARMTLEERVYRLRCVEAWAITVPWTGFPLRDLVELADPLGSAKYVRFETFMDTDRAPFQRVPMIPWPYVEGLTVEEAVNELAFVGTGMYGKPLLRQNGTPIRTVLPWKYGFKSIKSVVRISFTEERPVSFWEEFEGESYGFWANVNPDVPHPRWSQETEELLGTEEDVPTRLFNGYGDYVAHLYPDLDDPEYFR